MKLSGFIVQKIPPEEQDKYVEPFGGFVEGKMHICITKPGVSRSRLKRFLLHHWYKTRHGVLYNYIITDSCPHKIGEFVEFDVEIHYIESGMFEEIKPIILND